VRRRDTKRGLWRGISFKVACSRGRRRGGMLAKDEEDAPLGGERGQRDAGTIAM
jgi:hypothetical protein